MKKPIIHFRVETEFCKRKLNFRINLTFFPGPIEKLSFRAEQVISLIYSTYKPKLILAKIPPRITPAGRTGGIHPDRGNRMGRGRRERALLWMHATAAVSSLLSQHSLSPHTQKKIHSMSALFFGKPCKDAGKSKKKCIYSNIALK